MPTHHTAVPPGPSGIAALVDLPPQGHGKRMDARDAGTAVRAVFALDPRDPGERGPGDAALGMLLSLDLPVTCTLANETSARLSDFAKFSALFSRRRRSSYRMPRITIREMTNDQSRSCCTFRLNGATGTTAFL